MEMSVQVSDMPSAGHIVEGGFDGFSIVDSACNDRPSGFEVVDAQPNLRLYPNPSRGKIRLQGSLPDASGSAKLALVDLQGKELAEYKTFISPDGRIDKTVNLTDVGQGVYLLRITSEQSTTIKKISLLK
jgi:hypothetical protein